MKIEVIIKIVLESLIFVTSFLVVSTNASKVAMDNGGVMLENVTEHVRDFYTQVAPQAQIYFETSKDFTIKYGKIGLGKAADLILDGMDLAYDGSLEAWPYVKQGTDKTKEVLGPYVGPYIGPYWDMFYNQTVEQYRESTKLARSWVRQINFGEVNLEQLLFADEIEKENLEKAKLAAEKIKAAVEAMNKKMEEDKKAKEAEEKRKRLEEAEKKRQAMMQAQKEKQQAAGQGAKGPKKTDSGVSIRLPRTKCIFDLFSHKKSPNWLKSRRLC